MIEPIRLLRGGRDKNVYVLSRLRPARYGLGVGGDAYPSRVADEGWWWVSKKCRPSYERRRGGAPAASACRHARHASQAGALVCRARRDVTWQPLRPPSRCVWAHTAVY